MANKNMKYDGDTRSLTIEELEKILVRTFGGGEYERTAGCYLNGRWVSVDSILEKVSENI